VRAEAIDAASSSLAVFAVGFPLRGYSMTLPNFLIIGAAKSGSTWLAHMLRKHPDIYLPPAEAVEIWYFDRESRLKKGLRWYEQHFAAADGKRAIGEKTPTYYWIHNAPPRYDLFFRGRRSADRHLPDVHRRIHQTLPHVRLIAVLRNPVERAISEINQFIRDRRLSLGMSLDDYLMGKGRDLISESGVMERGRYYDHLKAYQECFEPGQMLVLIYEEDVVQRPEVGLRKACEFLAVDSSFEFSGMREKVGGAPPRSALRITLGYYLPFLRSIARQVRPVRRLMQRADALLLPAWKARPSDAVVRALHRLYAEDNERLFQLLKRGLPSAWRLDSVMRTDAQR
jgi:Sulfotransferase family